jgi:uncharacterized integral membrane protein
MKRWLLILLVALVVLASLVFAIRNAGAATLDIYGLQFTLPLGVIVLAALLAGCLAAGLVLWAGVILPLRLKLRQAARREATREPGTRADPAA